MKTVYDEEAVLGEVSSTIIKNQYLMYANNKIMAAADTCRNNMIPRSQISHSDITKRQKEFKDKVIKHG